MGTVRHYARQADPETFRTIAAKHASLDEHVEFEQSELRDYFLRVWGDNVLTFKDEPGVFYIWREDKAVWTSDDGTQLRHYIHEACKDLMMRNVEMWKQRYLTHHAAWVALKESDSPEALKSAHAEMEASKKKWDTITRTKKRFNDAETKAVFSLIKSKLATEAGEQNLFDERREVFAFANCCYNLQNNEFFTPTKYDYILTTNGKMWREPSSTERARIADLLMKVFPDPEKLKCWVSIAHAALSGKRHEKADHASTLTRTKKIRKSGNPTGCRCLKRLAVGVDQNPNWRPK